VRGSLLRAGTSKAGEGRRGRKLRFYMTDSSHLPQGVISRAFQTCNGEYAWRKEDLEKVLPELVDARLAVVSGEVWIVEGNLFCNLSPRKQGGWSVLAWKVSDRKLGETWARFTQRSLLETLDAIGSLNAEEEVGTDVHSKLYYHICYEDEVTYSPVVHAPVSRQVEIFSPSAGMAAG
jgi:hypothetical protein